MTVSEMQEVLSEYPPSAEVSLRVTFDSDHRANELRMVVGQQDDPLITWTLWREGNSRRGERAKHLERFD